MEKIINIVVAAGSGSRFGSVMPKQFCRLQESTVLSHAVSRIVRATPGSVTVVVLSEQFMDQVPQGCMAVCGGSTRWESVKNAIDATIRLPADVITIHDGARPLPGSDMISRVIDACRSHQGAIPVVDVTDSLRRTDGTAVARADFRAVQTPQAFRTDLLRQAYCLPYSPVFTDDASVMSAAGFTDIAMVEGDSMNLKITRPADLDIAGIYLKHGAGC